MPERDTVGQEPNESGQEPQGTEGQEPEVGQAGSEGQEPEGQRARDAEYVRKLRTENAVMRKRMRQYEQAEQERADAGKSELEKMSSRVAEAEREKFDALAAAAVAEIKADFTEQAIREGVTDLRLAYLAASSEGLLGSHDNGQVAGHNFKELKKKYPNLFAARPGSADGGAASSGAGAVGVDMNAALRRMAGR